MCQQNICRDHKDIFVVSTKDGEPASAGCESGPMTSQPLHQNLQNPQNLQSFSPQITKIFQIPYVYLLSISWFFFLWAENPNLLTPVQWLQ